MILDKSLTLACTFDFIITSVARCRYKKCSLICSRAGFLAADELSCLFGWARIDVLERLGGGGTQHHRVI